MIHSLVAGCESGDRLSSLSRSALLTLIIRKSLNFARWFMRGHFLALETFARNRKAVSFFEIVFAARTQLLVCLVLVIRDRCFGLI